MSSHESKSPRTELMQLVFSAKWWRICKNGVVANTCNTLIQAMKWDMVHTMYGQNDFFFFFTRTRNANFTSLVSPAGTLGGEFLKKKILLKKRWAHMRFFFFWREVWRHAMKRAYFF